MNDQLRAALVERKDAIENAIRQLVADAVRANPTLRDRREGISNRITILMASVEDVIYADMVGGTQEPRSSREKQIGTLHEKMDEIIDKKAELDRGRREIYHELEAVELEEKRLRADQVRREFDAELARLDTPRGP